MVVHTDNKKNLFYGTISHIAHWKVLIEEYGPNFQYNKGKNNVIADAMPRLYAMQKENITTEEQC